MADESSQKAELSETLKQLHAQLADVESMDVEMRAKLHDALEEIQVALDSDQTPLHAPDEHQSLLQRLGDAARHFEESHPALSGTVGSVIDALGRMGI